MPSDATKRLTPRWIFPIGKPFALVFMKNIFKPKGRAEQFNHQTQNEDQAYSLGDRWHACL